MTIIDRINELKDEGVDITPQLTINSIIPRLKEMIAKLEEIKLNVNNLTY